MDYETNKIITQEELDKMGEELSNWAELYINQQFKKIPNDMDNEKKQEIPFGTFKKSREMKKVKAIIEQASDGNYSVYMDADEMDYLVTGTGKTEEEAIQCFKNGYEDMKNYYAEEGMKFEEVEFEYVHDKS